MSTRQVSSLLTFILMLLVFTSSAVAEISVEQYCKLTIRDLKNRVRNLKQLSSSFTANKDEQRKLIQNEYKIKDNLKKQRGELFDSFEISPKDYVLYMGRHSKEVKKYLRKNPEIKEEIDRLSREVKYLRTEYAEAKEPEVLKDSAE